MSSETDRGISDQPPPTCPIIDAALSACNRTRDYAGQIVDADNDETKKSYFRDVDSELDHAEALMEDARSNVEDIREWGQEWKDRAQELENQLHAIKSDLSTMQEHQEIVSSFLNDTLENLEDI